MLSRKRTMYFMMDLLDKKRMEKNEENESKHDVGFMEDYEQIKKQISQFLKKVCLFMNVFVFEMFLKCFCQMSFLFFEI